MKTIPTQNERPTARRKMPVYIRAKTLKDGRRSLYLDIRGERTRSYQFLRLYLEPGNRAATRARNAEVMRVAERMKEEKAIELAFVRAGLEDRSFRAGTRLSDWMRRYEAYVESCGGSKSLRYNISATRKYLERFDADVLLRDVDGSFIDRFIAFMKKQTVTKGGAPVGLARNTVCCRLRTLRAALNFAVRKRVIPSNPCLDAETAMSEEERRREYLTMAEVERLIRTGCKKGVLKRAFMFSVFTGLRLSDIRSLTWRDIVKDGGRWRIEMRQKKTQAMLYLPLNRMARMWLTEAEAGRPEEKVFKGLGSSNRTDLTDWMRRAKVMKRITYHSSRHSFAVLALSAGVDVYTLSKLMGHSSVRNTQVYARIMEGNRRATVSLLDSVL